MFVGIVLVWVTVRFVPAYVSDKSQVNQAGYLGTIMGCIGLLVVVLQFLGWLRRRGSPESIAVQLRTKTGRELDQRLADMRRTTEDIVLTYRLSGNGRTTDLDGLIDVLVKQPGRVVLTGRPGVGKSYTALQVAAALIRRDPSIVPLVVPLSRWTETEEPTLRLVRFLADEFNVAASSADGLLRTGKVFPIFDGLDELCTEETAVEPAAELLAKLVDWRILGTRVPFFLACRRSTWDRIDDDLKSHHSLAAFSILAVDRDEARQYLARSLSGSDQAGPADELIRLLQRKGHGYLLTSPWQLSLMAEIVRDQLNRSVRIAAVDVEQITDLASVDSLIAHHVESSKIAKRWVFGRTRRALDYRWLSNYAK